MMAVSRRIHESVVLLPLLIFIFTHCWITGAVAEPEACLLPPDRGPCGKFSYMYFFNAEKQNCSAFPYGGCGGNDNRFFTYSECMQFCTGNSSEGVPDSTTAESPSVATQPATRATILPVTSEISYIDRMKFAQQSEPENPFVRLYDGKGKTTFTFASPSSYIQVGPDEITKYQIRNRRSVSLDFRTRLPHALLIYHGIKGRPLGIHKYELYVMLDQGQLKVKHLFGEHSTTVVVGKGLNRDRWHHVHVEIDPHEEEILTRVDQDENRMKLDGLREHKLYGASEADLESIIFVGGLKSGSSHLEVSYLANPFVGCIRNVTLATTPLQSSALMPIVPLISSRFQNVDEDCLDKCWDPRVPCSRDSKCINHYDHVECDCFSARFKGDNCKDTDISVLTLSGYSYVTFAIYEWMDKVHSDVNRISMHFKTRMDDSILFYAVGEIPYHNHIAASIRNHRIYIDINFGEGAPIATHIGESLTDGHWHILTIDHIGKSLTIRLDGNEQSYNITGPHYHLYIDPDIYIGGGGPTLKNRIGLNSSNNFVGCLKEVYFNEKSILFELYGNKHQARHHGLTAPVFGASCEPRNAIPITVPFFESGFRVVNPKQGELSLRFEFRVPESPLFGTLAYSDVRTINGEGFWELKIVNEEIHFSLHPDKSVAHTTTPKTIAAKYNRRSDRWSAVELRYHFGEFRLTTDRQNKNEAFAEVTQLAQVITLGTSPYKPENGFVGCIQRIVIGGMNVDARTIVGSDDQIGDIALDNCQFVDPCTRPDVCEHGGKCSVQRGEISCECEGSGYMGKHCHFAMFKRTCEELALLGYTKSGVYKIDIDGNGPYPPSVVKCKFETDSSGGETKTIVEHNLVNETDVWTPNQAMKDFKLELQYREFTPEMLMSLVSQSVQCSQHIKFDCYKAKLALQQYSWFKSADVNSRNVVSLGDTAAGMCPCSQSKTCAGYDEHCNCDSLDDRWLSDEGFFSLPERLGITQMYFMVPKDLPSDAAARITLGPLECVEANTQRYVVTFKTFGSYLEAPGWKSGDLAFSFRTTRSSAILLYQPLLHNQDNSFSVYLTNDHELTFRFILNGGAPQKVTVRSQRALSGGDWQQVWIDYDVHQVRFQINREHQMINLADGQQFGPFEGTMYIAGAPAKHLKDTEIQDGLIGCFRGLVMNGQVLDLYSYMKFHKADIVKDCSPSCDPNPCKNKALCQENWGSFTCLCQNPYSQSGQFCEHDINTDGLTFLSQSSYIVQKAGSNSPADPMSKILTSNFYLNLRTYDEEALVLYANDNLNNFVQLHIEGGEKVIFSWNHGETIKRLVVQPKKPLNQGESIQVAIIRNATHTALHVNNDHQSVDHPVNLLTKYSDSPFVNPELELFIPPRPFGKVELYHQLFLAGYDNKALKPTGNAPQIPGLLGCLRGLKIGDDRILLSARANSVDVLEGCKMQCDRKPCSNGGLCVEDFVTRTHTCDCTFTSYYGKKCDEERGASFSGEASIRQRFSIQAPEITKIEARFGFSSDSYNSAHDTILLSVRIPSRNYYLLMLINTAGHFILREHRGPAQIFSAIIQYQNFVDGARHSVYFSREGDEEALLIIDLEEIPVVFNETESLTYTPPVPSGQQEADRGDVFIGGVTDDNSTELKSFRDFRGCISNIYIEVNDIKMQTLEEYMGFAKKRPDVIIEPTKPEGIKSGACAPFSSFSILPTPAGSDPGNISLPEKPSDWPTSLPEKQDLHIRESEVVKSATISFNTLALIFAVFLAIIVIFVLMYLFRLNKRYKRRILEDDDDDDYYPYRSPVRFQDKAGNGTSQYAAYSHQNPAKVELLSNTINNMNSDFGYKKPSLTGSRLNNLTEEKAQDNPIREIDDENASDTTTSDNASQQSSSSNLSNTQVLDDKAPLHPRPETPPVTPTTIPEEEPETGDRQNQNEDVPGLVSKTPVFTTNPLKTTSPKKITPVFVSETVRVIEQSPIAIIGGPRYGQLKRSFNSKDSVVSLD